MKNTLTLLIIITSLSFITSCSSKSTAPKSKEELKQPTIGDDIPSDVATSIYEKAPITTKGVPELNDAEEDCHGKRRVGQTLEDVEGSILKVGDYYVISTNEGNSRYNPCALPRKLKKDGMHIRFSGDVLEIFPGERLIATPIRLKYIVESDH